MDRSREREKEYRFPCSFMFSIYWLKQRQKEIEMLDHPHCMFSDYFFRQEQAREIFFHMTSSLCLVENQRNGTAKKPMQSFLCDRHQNHRRVKSVSFSIIWHRHWERIGKILSSECKQVLKVRGEYQRLRLYAVFYSTIQDRCWMDLSTVY